MEKSLYHTENYLLKGAAKVIVTIILIALESIFIASLIIEGKWEPPVVICAIIITALLVALIYTALFIKFKVDVLEDRIQIKTFGKFIIEKNDVEKCEIISVKAIREFGGWGLRSGIKKRGYIVPGMDAVKITLKDGRNVTICSENTNEMLTAIQNMIDG